MVNRIDIQQQQMVCKEHGSFTAYAVAGRSFSGCPICRDRDDEAELRQRQREAREQARRERIAATLKAAIPGRYVDATLDEVSDSRVRAWAQACAAGENAGPLVLTGPVGTGKTFAAIAALRHIVEQRACVANYVVATDFTRRMRATWGRDSSESESDVLQRHARGLLVLDDLGAGPVTPELQDLISSRYANDSMAATVVCTNIAAAAFDDAFGQRIADRIRHDATLVVIGGKSRRRPSQTAAAASGNS